MFSANRIFFLGGTGWRSLWTAAFGMVARKHCKIPAGNRAFWKKKFAANKARDRCVNRELRKLGWRVLRIWEHDLARGGEASIRRIRRALG